MHSLKCPFVAGQCDSELLQLRLMNNSLEKKLIESRKLAETAAGLKETVSLLQTIILAKDEDVMRLTHEVNLFLIFQLLFQIFLC